MRQNTIELIEFILTKIMRCYHILNMLCYIGVRFVYTKILHDPPEQDPIKSSKSIPVGSVSICKFM